MKKAVVAVNGTSVSQNFESFSLRICELICNIVFTLWKSALIESSILMYPSIKSCLVIQVEREIWAFVSYMSSLP